METLTSQQKLILFLFYKKYWEIEDLAWMFNRNEHTIREIITSYRVITPTDQNAFANF